MWFNHCSLSKYNRNMICLAIVSSTQCHFIHFNSLETITISIIWETSLLCFFFLLAKAAGLRLYSRLSVYFGKLSWLPLNLSLWLDHTPFFNTSMKDVRCLAKSSFCAISTETEPFFMRQITIFSHTSYLFATPFFSFLKLPFKHWNLFPFFCTSLFSFFLSVNIV